MAIILRSIKNWSNSHSFVKKLMKKVGDMRLGWKYSSQESVMFQRELSGQVSGIAGPDSGAKKKKRMRIWMKEERETEKEMKWDTREKGR